MPTFSSFPTSLLGKPARLLLYALLACPWAVSAQSLAFNFLEPVKCPKNTRTVALLRASAEAYQLLRLQDASTDAEGKIQPETPWLVTLDADGKLGQQRELPGFGAADNFALVWKWGLAIDSEMLVVYEKRADKVGQRLFARRFHLTQGVWDAAEIALFETATGVLTTTGYRTSPNGQYSCIYAFSQEKNQQQLWAAVFDHRLQRRWQRSVKWAPKTDAAVPQQFFCTNEGALAVHAHAFMQSSKGAATPAPDQTPILWPDGTAALATSWDAAPGPAYSHLVCLVGQEQEEPDWYYPAVGKHFTSAVVLNQDLADHLYCAGFAGDHPGTAETYFLYGIDLKSKTGKMLQNAPLSGGLRKAFLSEKDAEEKAPVEGLNLLRLEWTMDGVAWLLAEQETMSGSTRMFKDAALLRLDSTFKIRGVQKIERASRHLEEATQPFCALAPIRAPKGGWYLCGNNGKWPQTKVILAECKRSGPASVYDIADCQEEGVTLLPHTVFMGDDKWYFVAESEYREMFRIAELGFENSQKRKRKR